MADRFLTTLEETRRTVRVLGKTQANQVRNLVRGAILSGEFAPGKRLIEARLAHQYECSRHVIREAFQILEAEGLVVSDPFRGRSVIKYDGKDIEGLFLMRVSLEATAAALAAYKITAEQSRELIDNARLLREAPSTFGQLVEWEAEIHRSIWKIAGEPRMTMQLEQLLWPLILTFCRIYESSHGALEVQLVKEHTNDPAAHGPLLKAICERNPHTARRIMVVHLIAHATQHFSQELCHALQAAFPDALGEAET
jgi:DNA-binding GntR family transcriptional regulator